MKRSLKILLVSFLMALLIVPLAGMIWYAWGQRSGEEFSPDDFSRRQFSYNRDPLFGILLKKKSLSVSTTAIDLELVNDGWIKPRIPTKKTWHLISDSQDDSELPSPACDARFLTEYLDLVTEDQDNVWSVWNRDHPQLAAIFWPIVAEMARDEMYLLFPDFMEFASRTTLQDPQQFRRELVTRQAAAYRQLGRIDFELGRFQRARHRLGKANQLEPDPELVKLLEVCDRRLEQEAVEASSED